MNGHLTNFLLWVATGLFSLVSALVAFIVHLHIKSDEDHRRLTEREFDTQKSITDQEIKRLRERTHDIERIVAEIKGLIRKE